MAAKVGHASNSDDAEGFQPQTGGDDPKTHSVTHYDAQWLREHRLSLCAITSVCCCCAMIGSIIGIIMLFVVKSTISPGPPDVCAGLPPTPSGYPDFETYTAVTTDDMSLQMWRIPSNGSQPTRPVLILSGLQCSSRDWFAGLDTDALPWTLWRSGFDVWVGNNRGTHLSETPSWDWTFEQMADHDLPAMIDMVLSTSGSQTLAYIGHSQGALQGFMAFSADAELASRISHFAAFSPAIFLTQQRYTWTVLTTLQVDDMVAWATARPGTPFLTYEEMMRDRCYTQSYIDSDLDACGRDMGGSFMPGDRGFLPSTWKKFQCIPSGTSSDNIRAFADGLRAGSFQSHLTNIGRPINFTALSMPISLAVGDLDLFMSVEDVDRIRTECRPGVVVDSRVLEGAGHMDLVWGTDAPSNVYVPLVERMLAR